MTTSAALTASALTSATFRPAFSTLGQEAPPLRRPTTTFTPLSLRFCAWAWPCAVADDGDRLALDQAQVTVFVVINLHGFSPWLKFGSCSK
jgi:hypothetical protein